VQFKFLNQRTGARVIPCGAWINSWLVEAGGLWRTGAGDGMVLSRALQAHGCESGLGDRDDPLALPRQPAACTGPCFCGFFSQGNIFCGSRDKP
jgi:hypothetical protein